MLRGRGRQEGQDGRRERILDVRRRGRKRDKFKWGEILEGREVGRGILNRKGEEKLCWRRRDRKQERGKDKTERSVYRERES